jgi:hypothetical protein
MLFLALADVRQTTCHPRSPPRALQFGIIPTCQVLFFPTFHSSMQGVERLSQETRVPQCRIRGKCAAFRAATVEILSITKRRIGVPTFFPRKFPAKRSLFSYATTTKDGEDADGGGQEALFCPKTLLLERSSHLVPGHLA